MNNGRRRNRSENSRYNLRPRRQVVEEPVVERPAQRRRVAAPVRPAADPAPPPPPPPRRRRMGVAEPANLAEIVLDEYMRDDLMMEEEDEEESEEYTDDDESTSSNDSGDAVIIEEDDEEDAEMWNPFIPFNVAPDNFNNFFDIFRRIASGFSTSMYRLDTLGDGEGGRLLFYLDKLPFLPHSAHIAIHRTYIVPPFTNILVDSVPSDTSRQRVIQRKHIFLTNYTRSSWNGLQSAAKKLRQFKSTIWCTVETAQKIKRHHHPLWLEIQDMLNTLEPGKLYQVTHDDIRDRFAVIAIPLDAIPGSCMYLISREGKFLVHTGNSAGHQSFDAPLQIVLEHAPSIDVLYLDSALYYPSREHCYKANLDLQEVALAKTRQFINHVTADGGFVTILFHNGMEKLFLGLVASLNCKIGITEEIYEPFYGHLHQYGERVTRIPFLGRKQLTSEEREERVFFYTESSAEYHQIHTTNPSHTRLFVVYDIHSCLERATEAPAACRGIVLRKTRRHPPEQREEDEEEENDGTYYILFPMHPSTIQARRMNSNNRGIVLCFLIYLSLCSTIISIIEMPWVTIPSPWRYCHSSIIPGVMVNMTDLVMNRTAYQFANVSDGSNVTFIATRQGFCGISGYCYPFEDDSVMVSLLTGEWGQRCNQMNPLTPFYDTPEGEEPWAFSLPKHAPFYTCIAGAVFLLLTWIVGICSCCNYDCGYCTIYSVFAVLLAFSCSVFLAGATMFFMFSDDPSSCIGRICSDVNTPFSLGRCDLGWSMWVAAAGTALGLILSIVACVLASKTPLGSRNKPNKIIEVKPGPSRGQRHKFITTSAA
eukprot:sb/3462129/